MDGLPFNFTDISSTAPIRAFDICDVLFSCFSQQIIKWRISSELLFFALKHWKQTIISESLLILKKMSRRKNYEAKYFFGGMFSKIDIVNSNALIKC